MEISPTELAPRPVIEAVMRRMAEPASEAGIELRAEIGHEVPAVMADSHALLRILVNLLMNAIKFTPRGGMALITAVEDRAGFVAIRVGDTGIGIAAEHVPEIIKPFTQADDRMAKAYDGTGLGLPIAAALVRLNGGRLEIESKPGLGTIVTVLLPAAAKARLKHAA